MLIKSFFWAFPYFFPHSSCFLLRVCSHLKSEFWFKPKGQRSHLSATHSSPGSVAALFPHGLFTFKLFILRSFHFKKFYSYLTVFWGVGKIQNEKAFFSEVSWKSGMLFSVSISCMDFQYYLLFLWGFAFSFSQNHRKWVRLEGITGGHRVQLACSSSILWSMLLRISRICGSKLL